MLLKHLTSLFIAIVCMLMAACARNDGYLASHSYMQVLGTDGRIVTVDPRTGEIVEDPKTTARREAREKKEAEREARRQGRKVTELPPPEPEYWWRGDGIAGRPSIVINLSEQRAYFLKSGTVVGMTTISSGREGYQTPTGSYSIIQKNRDHVSNLYGDYVDQAGNVVVANVGVRRDARPPGTKFRGAPMPYFMRIVGAVGMHAGYLPGYPASHGCIRLPEEMARIYFENVSHGTPVAVRY